MPPGKGLLVGAGSVLCPMASMAKRERSREAWSSEYVSRMRARVDPSSPFTLLRAVRPGLLAAAAAEDEDEDEEGASDGSKAAAAGARLRGGKSRGGFGGDTGPLSQAAAAAVAPVSSEAERE